MRRHGTVSRKPSKTQHRKPTRRKRGTAPKPARNRRLDVRKDTEIARLARELTEAREQQAATSEILRVISSSHSDLQPVFDTIARSAVDLCGATYGMVFRYDGELLSVVAHYNLDQTALDAYQKIWPMQPDNRTATGRTVLERKIVHIPDVEQEPRYTFAAAYRASIGIRTYLGVPMLRDGNPIGAIALYRGHVALFSDREIELVKAFADQAASPSRTRGFSTSCANRCSSRPRPRRCCKSSAPRPAIAIENTRLLNELRESLQQQTELEITRRISLVAACCSRASVSFFLRSALAARRRSTSVAFVVFERRPVMRLRLFAPL